MSKQNPSGSIVGEVQKQHMEQQEREPVKTVQTESPESARELQRQQVEQQRERLEEQNVKQQQQQQQQQQPIGGASTSVVGGKTITTTITTQEQAGTTFGTFGAPLPSQQVRGKIINEPTIDLLNRFVAKDTHCLLGKTGIKISRICLGTMNFGEITPEFGSRPGQLSESEAHAVLDRYFELGGNCIDTANFFPWFGPDVGKSEMIIGNWLSKQNREKIFLMTKVRMPMDTENINSVGLSRGHIIDSVNDSLKRLQTDTIDMLVLNGWDPTVSFHETVRHLDELVKCEKVRYIGVCDMKGWQLQKFIDAAKIQNLHKCVCYMGEYNLLTRGCELEVVDVCKNERIGFIAYSPLKYGFLTNESVENINKPVADSRIEAATSARLDGRINLASMAESFECIKQNPVYMNVLNVCQQLSNQYNVSISKVAVQWILQKGFVTSVCVGVEDKTELDEKMECLVGDFVLSPQDMDQLDLASSVHLHYPYRTQLAEVAGFRAIKPLSSTEFEQLNVLTHALELDTLREQRMDLTETWHEGVNQPIPEREYLMFPKMKAYRRMQQAPYSSLASGVQQASLIDQAKIIQ